MVEEILEHNKKFVADKGYEPYITSNYPDKKLCIVTCMDTRLVELLPLALGIKNGDVKVVKNAGGVVDHPYGSEMKSLIIGVYELKIEEILIIGHSECGARCSSSVAIEEKMLSDGVTEEELELVKKEVDFAKWLDGFQELENTIKKSVKIVKNHPLMKKSVAVHGLIIDSKTGELTKIV